jgi:hypothetical protein
MADVEEPGEPEEPFPQQYLIKLPFQGVDHYVFCEAVISCNWSKVPAFGQSALEELAETFLRRDATVSVLPPPGDECAPWSRHLAFLQSGKKKIQSGDNGG